MLINDYINKIKELHACGEAIADAHQYQTSQELWDSCERGDWMLWLIDNLLVDLESDSGRKLVLTICKCARLLLKDDDIKLLIAIKTAEAWASRKEGITLQNVIDAADDIDAFSTETYTTKEYADIVRREYPNIDDLFAGVSDGY